MLLLGRMGILIALALAATACGSGDSASSAEPAAQTTEPAQVTSLPSPPTTTATVEGPTSSADDPTSATTGPGSDTSTTTEPAVSIGQVLAEELVGGVFVGPCADVAPHSGADQHVCSLQPTTGSSPGDVDVMVGPTRDWSGNPDGPFATDFGVVIVHLRSVGSSWEVAGYTDIGLPVDIAGFLSPDDRGLGIGAEFGTPIDELLSTLDAVLGQPTADSGWTSDPDCASPVRRVSWSGLEAIFIDGPGGPELRGYRLEGTLPETVRVHPDNGVSEAGETCG